MYDKIIFLSDTHFKYHSTSEKESKKRKYFLDFLRRIEGIQRLYLLGDIFDFWFEYGSVIPRYYRDILDGLYTLRKGGTLVFITGGNHDYWLGSYLPEELGITVLEPVTTHRLQGRTITLTHGDMLPPGDYTYKTLKAVIRSRPVIALARLVHPDILFGFARRFSKTSKEISDRKTEESAKMMAKLARDSLFRWDNDTFVMGHIHHPCIEYFGEKVFVLLGDWENNYSYLRLEKGEFHLEFYRPAGNTLMETR